MKFVKCINNGECGWLPSTKSELTEGKIYEVLETNGSSIRVINDFGVNFGYTSERFENVSDEESLKALKETHGQLIKDRDALNEKVFSTARQINDLTLEVAKKNQVTVGSRWKESRSGDEYLVVRTSSEYLLVCLRDGGCWQYPKQNIEDIFGSSRNRFTKLP